MKDQPLGLNRQGRFMTATVTLSAPTVARLRAEKSRTHKGVWGKGRKLTDVVLYVPKNLDLKDRLNGTERAAWLRPIRFIKLLFIVSCLYWFPVVTKASDGSGDGYVQLKFTYLKRILGTEYARPALDVLLDLGVIESDGHYVVGTKSIGYRLAARYRGQVQSVKIHAPALAAKLAAQREQSRPAPAPSSSLTPAAPEWPFLPVYAWIQGNLDRLTYPEDVEQYVTRFTGAAYDQRKLCVEAVRHRSSFFTIDHKTGRCFHIVTNTPKELRERLLLDGEQTTEVDVASAQPLLAATLYPDDCPEKYRYLAAIDADFYLTLNAWAGYPHADRKAVKTACYTEIFFGGIIPEAPLWKAFRTTFPWLAGQIVKIKQEHRGPARYRIVDGKKVRRRGNPAFALLLQRKEAEVVIQSAGEALRASGVPFVTVHDSFLCRHRDASEVNRVLAEKIQEITGFASQHRQEAA